MFLRLTNPYTATEADLYKLSASQLEADGYDGVKLTTPKGDVYMVLDPEQIKSADTVTYDDSGSVIPLSQRFNPQSNDVRYSISFSESIAPVARDVEVYGQDIGIDAPVREDLYGDVPEEFFGETDEAFDAMLDEIEIRDTRQRLDAILCMTTKFQIHYETVNFSKNPAVHRIFHLQPLTKWFIIPKSMQK